MTIEYANVDGRALGARWWMLVVRGIAAVSFGVLALAWPGISLLAFVLLWGAYALVDGAAAVALAARAGSDVASCSAPRRADAPAAPASRQPVQIPYEH